MDPPDIRCSLPRAIACCTERRGLKPTPTITSSRCDEERCPASQRDAMIVGGAFKPRLGSDRGRSTGIDGCTCNRPAPFACPTSLRDCYTSARVEFRA